MCGSKMASQRTNRRAGQRGEGRFNTIITLAILGGMIFTGVKIVPVYFAKYQLQDSIDTESKFALTGYPKKTPDDVRNDVYKKAQDLGVPAKPEDIQVNMSPTDVEINVDYTAPIDLAVYQWAPQFHLHADNRTI